MSPGTAERPLRVTVVAAPGCHFCDDAESALDQLIRDGAPIQLDVVLATSEAGRSLLATHRPAMNPLVLVDGAYFSAGRLPRRKLQALLARRTAEVAAHRG